MDKATIEKHLKAIDQDGYTIVENAMEPDLVRELRDEVRRAEKVALGDRSARELAATLAQLRTNGLLSQEAFQRIPIHPNVLPIVEGVVGEGCLLSADAALDALPGMRRLALHPDDALYGMARPHTALMCTAMWALTDFTSENGATIFTPGSHRFPDTPDFSKDPSEFETVPAEMAAGSVLIFDGQLWHTSGENTTKDEWRLGLQLSYCVGWDSPPNELLHVDSARGGSPPPRPTPTVGRLRHVQRVGQDLGSRGAMGHQLIHDRDDRILIAATVCDRFRA